jgi:alkyl hydroperoxide reductase subunit F
MLDANIKASSRPTSRNSSAPSNSSPPSTTAPRPRNCASCSPTSPNSPNKVALRENGKHALRPSFGVAEPGEAPRIHFAGIPMGHEFTSLVLALLQTGGHPPKVDQAVIDQIKALPAVRVRDLHLACPATTARTWCRPST